MRVPLSRLIDDDEEDVDVPEVVVRAVERAGARSGGGGARVTEADVSVLSGLSLDDTRRGLLALARQTAGDLEVTDGGEIVYAFTVDVRGALRQASARARRREAWNIWQPRLERATRITFGAALLASIAIVYTAIAVISASASTSDDRDSRGSRTVYVHNTFSPLDLWYYSEPRGNPVEADGRRRKMGFLEACFSFVFGDGDPNAELRERRWRLVAALIRENRGVVTAEQLAPFLEPDRVPAADGTADGEGVNVEESFVLPALTRFSGVPTVVTDRAGSTRIVYTFPDLGSTAEANGDVGAIERTGPSDQQGYLEEADVPFSLAETDQLMGAGALGVANLAGVLYLGRLLAVLRATGTLSTAGGTLSSVGGVVALASILQPALTAYAIIFAGLPIARQLWRSRTNAARSTRNKVRREWATAVRRPTTGLDRKFRAARTVQPDLRQLGTPSGKGRVVFSTKVSAEPGQLSDDEAGRLFDERLAERTRPRRDGDREPYVDVTSRKVGDDDVVTDTDL